MCKSNGVNVIYKAWKAENAYDISIKIVQYVLVSNSKSNNYGTYIAPKTNTDDDIV